MVQLGRAIIGVVSDVLMPGVSFLRTASAIRAENLVLRRQLTHAERALLARKAKAVGRKALLELDRIVSADTLLRSHRRLIGEKWNFAHRREVGRHRKGATDHRRVVRRGGDCSAFG